MTNKCPLCNSEATQFNSSKRRVHYQCNTCHGIFTESSSWLSSSDEKAHYNQHNNDVEDAGYQKFVSPIFNAIFEDFTSESKGLDFGAGTGPVLSKLLRDKGYSTALYDPYFHNNPALLKETYDYIGSCEVIEHFYNPHKEFTLLKHLLKPNGKLYCMTHIYEESIDFTNWYYKNDPTHVFIYHKKTFAWIKKEFGFKSVEIKDRLVCLSV